MSYEVFEFFPKIKEFVSQSGTDEFSTDFYFSTLFNRVRVNTKS